VNQIHAANLAVNDCNRLTTTGANIVLLPRSNNFDILRLLLATIVVLAHCHELSRESSLAWVPLIANSRLAVEGFFAMSGCLIISSYERSPSIRGYLTKRARRILPAYWGALVFTIVLGVVFSKMTWFSFLMSPETWKYVAANISFLNFLHPSLPGLFAGNPQDAGVNGALWTIKIEVLFYLSVPVIVAACRKFGIWQTLGSLFVVSVIYRSLCEKYGHLSLAVQLPGEICFFVVGALVFYHFNWFKDHPKFIWFITGCCYLGFFITDWLVFRAIGTPLVAMSIGLLLPPYKGFTKYGDFSYGIYVLHCPIVQLFVALGIFRLMPNVALIFVMLIVSILAFISWNLIEKPFLFSKRS
jgi:peptidoglycan/LPS O-acetylase OafA/YrhL